MKKIGLMLRIDEDTLDDWISISPISRSSLMTVNPLAPLTGMLVNDLEIRQTMLSSTSVEEAVENR